MQLVTILTWLKNNWGLLFMVVLIGGAEIHGRFAGAESVQSEWDKSIVEAQKQSAEKSVKLEADLAAQRTLNTQTNAKLERAIHANADYTNCHVSADGLRALRDAIGTR